MTALPGAASVRLLFHADAVPVLRRVLLSPLGNRLVLFLLAGAIGALVGITTIGLIRLILLVLEIGFGTASEAHLAAVTSALPAWRVILVPTLGGLLVGIVMHFLPERRYHGIADVMEACALNSARIPVRSGIGAALAAAVSLGVGAPLGREGPAVHIGASMSGWLAERLQLDHKQSLALLGCGAAAAVAVSFNTPIAAVIFALEVIVGYYTLRVFAPVVVAVMLAMVVRTTLVGDAPLFPLPAHNLVSLTELIWCGLLGLLGALVARTLILMVVGAEQLWKWLQLPRWIRPAVAGALIGLVAIPVPLILGIGFEGTFMALQGDQGPTVLGLLLVVKLVVVALALSSGFAGGIFGPAIFVGAMLGGLLWIPLSLVGVPLADQGVYATIGMAAVGSALLGAPISTVLIVFELTRDYSITLGVMTAAAIASTTMQLGRDPSFFRWQLARRNVNLSTGRDMSLLMTHRVEELVREHYVTATPDITIGELESKMGVERQRVAVFVDADEVFCGSVSLTSLIAHAIENGMDSLAIEAAFEADFAASRSTNIVTAVQTLAASETEFLPVVDASEHKRPRLLGVVYKADLLAEHYAVIKRAREDEFGIT